MGKRQNNQIKKEFFKSETEIKKSRKQTEETIKHKDIVLKQEVLHSIEPYTNFFISKNSKKIILYDKFPNLDEMITYYSAKTWNAPHPLEEYGKFDIKELANIIRILYSIQRQQEYQVLTFGELEKKAYTLLEGNFEELIPKLYFLIGNEETLEIYQEYKNLFLEQENLLEIQEKYSTNLIALSPKNGTIQDTLNIKCQCPGCSKNYLEGGIQYYDYLNDNYSILKSLSCINIFDEYFYQKINNYKGIQDTLSFKVHKWDDFIAKILISISIYKKNIQKIKLTNEDYHYIFYELFKENINLEKEIKKSIPKTLRYIPRKK